MLCFDSSYIGLCLWTQQWQFYIPIVDLDRSWKWPSIHVYQKFLLIEVYVCTNAWRNSLASSAAVSFEMCCTNMPWQSYSPVIQNSSLQKEQVYGTEELRFMSKFEKKSYKGCWYNLFRVVYHIPHWDVTIQVNKPNYLHSSEKLHKFWRI